MLWALWDAFCKASIVFFRSMPLLSPIALSYIKSFFWSSFHNSYWSKNVHNVDLPNSLTFTLCTFFDLDFSISSVWHQKLLWTRRIFVSSCLFRPSCSIWETLGQSKGSITLPIFHLVPQASALSDDSIWPTFGDLDGFHTLDFDLPKCSLSVAPYLNADYHGRWCNYHSSIWSPDALLSTFQNLGPSFLSSPSSLKN